MSTEIVRFCDSVAPGPVGVPDRRTECQRHYGHAGWHEAENPGEWPMPSFKTQWRERTPRTWELPPEPGPEVKRLTAVKGDVLINRDPESSRYWQCRSAATGADFGTFDWRNLFHEFAPLVDATEETTP